MEKTIQLIQLMINMRCFIHLLLITLLFLNNAVFSQSLEDLFHDKKEIYFKFKFQSVNKTNKLSNIISIDHKTNKEDMCMHMLLKMNLKLF